MKRLHSLSGLFIGTFVGLHLFNHFMSVFGAARHIAVMEVLRHFYRNSFIEVVLLFAILTQVITGIKLFVSLRKTALTTSDKIQIWTGLYLAIFFVVHLSAIFTGRLYLHLDTNFYFGVAGLNTFPFYLFFIPYYALAIISVSAHLSNVHYRKMKHRILGLSPRLQSLILFGSAIAFTILIFYGLTNHFLGVPIPKEYNILIAR